MKFTVENGCFSYKGGGVVLSDVSLEANSGDIVAILGPNGSGKTTLLRCAMGFLRWTGGGSFIDGRELQAIPRDELWRTISYVPQARDAASPYTAEEMVLLGRSGRFGMFSQPGARDIEKSREVMETLGIAHLRDKRCAEISGGEMQMVLIARALAAEPRILILDEPESNLDFRNQLIIMSAITRLSKQGITCVFNTHYPAHALQYADKALLLGRRGESVFGDAASVVTEAGIESAFGVKAVIGELETEGGAVRDVVPVMLSDDAEQ